MNTPANKPGLLLVNLGTPDAPHSGPVRRYLREFLSDPRVVDIHPVGRWMLLNLIILPTRPAKSAEAYRKVWMPEGSPLLVYSRALEVAVREKLGHEYDVALAMRYGSPSIPDTVAAMRARGVSDFTVLPLYPQEATSSSASSLARVYEVLSSGWDVPNVRAVPAFHGHPSFLDAFAQVARPVIAEARADHVLFSYHGVPERHVRKTDTSGQHCFASAGCCDALTDANRHCYRAQCFATTRGIVERLGLAQGGFSVSFQSRLGRTPWVKPYTDLVLPELAKQGVKRLAVMCPSFVADCLETLEEVGMRAREQFVEAGGESLTLVPSLNAHPAWVDAVVRMVRESDGAATAGASPWRQGAPTPSR
ncbi:ferrochelatase [Myxococcus fulvus]|uniref:Ferrochelatase n=1 Tax=Myxococcus fulvus TaxID=33 RepID=A0A511TEE1_MYXFU|nr:ferrochelatase [Myxococcus fulvus]AKF80163.1 ferrochelatase [Myxococcus fulvus 124B02]GEN11762.1 ferrochelatase [Myxococcus fulvus]SEU40434.1 ferrochelatase [Myxococcus fulvus]